MKKILILVLVAIMSPVAFSSDDQCFENFWLQPKISYQATENRGIPLNLNDEWIYFGPTGSISGYFYPRGTTSCWLGEIDDSTIEVAQSYIDDYECSVGEIRYIGPVGFHDADYILKYLKNSILLVGDKESITNYDSYQVWRSRCDVSIKDLSERYPAQINDIEIYDQNFFTWLSMHDWNDFIVIINDYIIILESEDRVVGTIILKGMGF